MKKSTIFSRYALITVSMLLFANTAMESLAGPKFEISEDSWMQLSVLGQPHFSYMDNDEGSEDFYLRRGRIILSGQIYDGVKFFLETDNANAGRDGCDGVETELQDIFVDIRLGESDHWVQAGLILLPFSFEVKSSAASLLGVDYNAEAVKLDHCFVWRDYGVEFHGNVGTKFGYHAGVFEGYDSGEGTINGDAGLRYTGHLAFNVVGDVQTGWFYSQNRLGDEAYLSIGVGADHKSEATLTADEEDEGSDAEDSTAWVVDFQSGFNVGEAGLTLNGALYEWDNSRFEGTTAFLETGLLVNKLMLTGKYSLQDSDADDAARVEDYTVGLHYFSKGHNLRGGVEYRTGDSDDAILCGLQFLL